LPKFSAAPRDDGGARLGAAFADTRLTGKPRNPIVAMMIPSMLDSSLA
jgi:hypothetical protein